MNKITNKKIANWYLNTLLIGFACFVIFGSFYTVFTVAGWRGIGVTVGFLSFVSSILWAIEKRNCNCSSCNYDKNGRG